MSHVIPLLDKLKRRAYCKFHNTFSHATNDCNVLRRQIQPAVNEGRIIVPQMKVDQNPFPAHIHMLELSNPKVLIRPNQAESANWKNIIVGEERSEFSNLNRKLQQRRSLKIHWRIQCSGEEAKKKWAESAKTGLTVLETGLTGHSGNSGKNSRNKKEKKAEF